MQPFPGVITSLQTQGAKYRFSGFTQTNKQTNKAYRQKGWWTSGNDKLVAYEKELVVWINGKDTVQAEMVDKLKSLLTSKGEKD